MHEEYSPKFIEDPEIIKKSFNDNEVDCIFVRVDGEEYEVCERVSGNYWANSKGGFYGAGLANTEGDPYKTVRIGLLGQMAFSKLFNQKVDIKYRNGGDKYDNKICGLKIDIKCSMKNHGKGLVYCRNESGREIPLDKHVYVFSYLEKEDRINKVAEIVFMGFALNKEVKNCNIENGYRGNGHKNYVVMFDSLRPIIKLLEYKKEKEKEKLWQVENQ